MGTRPLVPRFLFLDLPRHQVDQVPERSDGLPFDADRASVAGLGVPELCHDVVDDHRVLGTLVLCVGEEEDHQVLVAELDQRPEERREIGAAAHIRYRPVGPRPWWSVEADRPEWLGGQSQHPVATFGVLVEAGVGSIEMQQVLTLHVEDQGPGVDHGRTEHPGREQRVEEKGRVAGLGGDTGDTGDVDMGASLSVYELEVGVQWLAIARSSYREPALHPIEEQRLVALDAMGPAHRLSGPGRDEDLGLDPGGCDLGRFHDLGRQHTVLDEEHIGVETPLRAGRAPG